MCKKCVSLIFIIMILLGIIIYQYWKGSRDGSKLQPKQQGNTLCSSKDLDATATFNPAAGNIWGTFQLKNTSGHSCQIFGGKFISVDYDTNAVKNISVIHTGALHSAQFILTPGQLLYSQVHYPNGPQCQSIGLRPVEVVFLYTLSPTDSIAFKSPDGNTKQTVQTCMTPNDMTEIQIWNMSATPITP